MMKQVQRKLVYALIAVFLLCSAVFTELLRPGHEEYWRAATTRSIGDIYDTTGNRSKLAGTPFQTLMPTLFGVREVLASLMWVRADDYFHRGEYRPIISMVHEITAIDPHQLDVYATGAWHMAYNFMDKRLIEDGVQFLQEGCDNNDSVYDLFFERGYMHYDKTKNYPESVIGYREATLRGTTAGKATPPAYVRHQLAHAMEKMGDIDSAVKQWQDNVALSTEELRVTKQKFGPASPNLLAAQHNLYITARRENERLAALAERDGNRAEAIRLREANVQLAKEWLAREPGHPDVSRDLAEQQNQVERLKSGKLNPAAPSDLDLHLNVVRVAPRSLEVSGTINALDLSRVRVQIQDKDYNEIKKRGFDYKMSNGTLEWDTPSVRQGRFLQRLKLDQDPADMGRNPEEIYPLKSQQYTLTVSYDPRTQAAFIQDRYGWNGEGLTAKGDLLKVDPSKAGIMNGKRFPLRTVEKSITLTRDDILGSGTKVIFRD